MTKAYTLREGLLREHEVIAESELPADALWVDMLAPTEEERRWVVRAFDQELPTEADVAEIEASSRYFADELGSHVRSYFLQEEDAPAATVTVAFLMNRGRLFTLHRYPVKALDGFVRDAAASPLVDGPETVMLRIFESHIDALADQIEGLHMRLERIGRHVVEPEERDLGTLVTAVSRERDANDKIRLSLMDMERALSHMLKRGSYPDAQVDLLRELVRDIDSLTAHSAFHFERTDSLMGQILGRISMEQNRIIKIFSVVAVVLLPPTLIASIYGMNFRHMPELTWPFGYPAALLVMIASAVTPYLFFRRKGWL